MYTIMVSTYWNPIPRSAQIRYPETGYTRQTIGGCGVWNSDADWANDTVVHPSTARSRTPPRSPACPT